MEENREAPGRALQNGKKRRIVQAKPLKIRMELQALDARAVKPRKLGLKVRETWMDRAEGDDPGLCCGQFQGPVVGRDHLRRACCRHEHGRAPDSRRVEAFQQIIREPRAHGRDAVMRLKLPQDLGGDLGVEGVGVDAQRHG